MLKPKRKNIQNNLPSGTRRENIISLTFHSRWYRNNLNVITKLLILNPTKNIIGILRRTDLDLCDAQVKGKMMMKRSRRRRSRRCSVNLPRTRSKIKGVYVCVKRYYLPHMCRSCGN